MLAPCALAVHHPGSCALCAARHGAGQVQLCTRLAIDALRSAAGVRPVLLGYSLWGCFRGEKGRVVKDISPHIRKKVEAVLAHSSQIAYKNYQQGILGKSNYEAIFWESHEPQKMSFVETFLDMAELLEKKESVNFEKEKILTEKEAGFKKREEELIQVLEEEKRRFSSPLLYLRVRNCWERLVSKSMIWKHGSI